MEQSWTENTDKIRYIQYVRSSHKGPFTLAVFAAILGANFSTDVMAIGNRQCKHPAISVRFQCDFSAIQVQQAAIFSILLEIYRTSLRFLQ